MNIKNYYMIMNLMYNNTLYASISRLYLDYINKIDSTDTRLTTCAKEILKSPNNIDTSIYSDMVLESYYKCKSLTEDLGFSNNYNSVICKLIKFAKLSENKYYSLINNIVKILNITDDDYVYGCNDLYKLLLLNDTRLSSSDLEILEMISILSINKQEKYSKIFYYSCEKYTVNKNINDKYLKEFPDMCEVINTRTSKEWLDILQLIKSTTKKFKMIALVPNGILYRSSDTAVRKYLIENGKIEDVMPVGELSLYSLIIISNNNDSTKFNNMRYDLRNTNSISSNAAEIKLTDIASLQRGCTKTAVDFIISDKKTEYQLLSTSNIENDIIDYSTLPYIVNVQKYEKYIVQDGDILLSTKTTKLKIAYVNKPSSNIIAGSSVTIIRPKNNIDGAYLYLLLKSKPYRDIINSCLYGNRVCVLSHADLNKLTFAQFPEIDEQKRISSKLIKLLDLEYKTAKKLSNLRSSISNIKIDKE